MTNSNKSNRNSGAEAQNLELEADVLFQKIYDKWYAFSVVDEDCLMTEVTEDEVQKRLANKRKILKPAA